MIRNHQPMGYTPGSSNIAVAGKWGPRNDVWILLKVVIFHCHVSLLEGNKKNTLNFTKQNLCRESEKGNFLTNGLGGLGGLWR